jgi:post-segregation antitoxin (ccd killing protein)
VAAHAVCVYVVVMARINIYLPDDTAEAARREGLNVSRVCREAVEAALSEARQRAWLTALQDREPIELPPDEVLAAVREAQTAIEGGGE